jgi:hypothetical protein
MAKVSSKWSIGNGQGEMPVINLLPNVPPAATTPGKRPVSATPPAATIWSPPNLTIQMPNQLPTIGKPGQG